MEARTTITVTREDILDLIRAKGYDVPDDATINTGDYDDVLPLIVSFKMDCKYVPKVDNGGLTQVWADEIRAIASVPHCKIHAIRRLRELTGWGLVKAKDWVDKYCPDSTC